MSLRKKLLAAFLGCDLVLVAIGILGLCGFSSLNHSLHRMAGDTLFSVRTLAGMSEAESFTRAAIRTLLIPELPSDRVANQVTYIRQSHQQTQKAIAQFERIAKSDEEQRYWQRFKADFQSVAGNVGQFLELSDQYRAGGNARAYASMLALHLGEHAKAFNDMRAALDQLVALQLKEADRQAAAADRLGNRITAAFMAALALALAGSIAISWLLARNVLGQLGGDPHVIRDAAQTVASGDLTAEIDVSRAKPGSVQDSVRAMIDNLSKLVADITDHSCSVATSAIQLHGNTEKIGIGFTRVETEIVSISTACDEMAATSADIAGNCRLAAERSSKANEATDAGVKVVTETISGMRRIADRVRSSSQTVDALGKRSEQIGEIAGTIEDIADQTNLLALNAAIEAARAGEQGRGFAVVADEVRALAERTTKATREIGEMIKAIQSETRMAVASMVEGVEEVERGVEASHQSEEALEQIRDIIGGLTSQIGQIATCAEQQTSTTRVVAQNIHHSTEALSETVHSSRQNAEAVTHLIKLSEDLLQSVRVLKTKGNALLILNLSKNDHRLFVSRIRSAVHGRSKIDPHALATHETCRFGKWYHGEGRDVCGSLSAFRDIEQPHQRIHAIAKDAVAAYNGGDHHKAQKLFDEVEKISHVIVDKLAQIAHQSEGANG